jgi:hypothetical protein
MAIDVTWYDKRFFSLQANFTNWTTTSTMRLAARPAWTLLSPTSAQRLFFSTCVPALKRPVRPEPIGEIVAHFPQLHKTEVIRESKEEFEARWKKYVDELGDAATPEKLGGASFGTQVRKFSIGTGKGKGRKKRKGQGTFPKGTRPKRSQK